MPRAENAGVGLGAEEGARGCCVVEEHAHAHAYVVVVVLLLLVLHRFGSYLTK